MTEFDITKFENFPQEQLHEVFQSEPIEFQEWPKIARLNRDIVVTEKIDGTNAAIGIQEFPLGYHVDRHIPKNALGFALGPDHNTESGLPDVEYVIYAQSKNKVITQEQDNHGFAKWVFEHGHQLAHTLGKGLHFGEWWGSGIQRGYGLLKGEKRFSLFNTPRYGDPEKFDLTPLKELGVDTVPVLYEGLFAMEKIQACLDHLQIFGSMASPLFMDPEGIVVFHKAAQVPFKVTLKNDEVPKGLAK